LPKIIRKILNLILGRALIRPLIIYFIIKI